MADNEGVAASLEVEVLPRTLNLVMDWIEAFQSAVHAMGGCWMRAAWRK